MALLRNGLIVLALAVGIVVPKLAGAEDLDRTGFKLVFDEDFAKLSIRGGSNPDGRWKTKFHWGGRTLPTNAEQQLYVDREYLGLGLDPFSVKDGILTITGRKTDERLRSRVGMPYVSGLLTTERSFAQAYGYYEVRAQVPAGKGLWPAFWLLPTSGKWPPEIDVFEILGHEPDMLHMAIHSNAAGNVGFHERVGDLSTDFHVYGLLWTPDTITWYLDGKRLAETNTPSDMHSPMHLLVNLAVGGKWPGNPDETTKFPAEFKVDYVRAYATPQTRPRF